jgi:hypothetical protein
MREPLATAGVPPGERQGSRNCDRNFERSSGFPRRLCHWMKRSTGIVSCDAVRKMDCQRRWGCSEAHSGLATHGRIGISVVVIWTIGRCVPDGYSTSA